MVRDAQLSLHRGCPPVVETEFHPDSDRTFTEALVEAVAKAEGVDPTELPPLYDDIELDVLSTLFERQTEADEARIFFGLQFETGWNVYITSEGRIHVCDATVSTVPAPVFETHAVGQL
ncbi:MAG: HalOD1 output domain-containing protein [Halapricum sp.]